MADGKSMVDDDVDRGEAVPKSVRRVVGGLLVVAAVAHAVFPHLAIDLVFLALVGAGYVVTFFDIRSIEVGGVKATIKRQLNRKLRELDEVDPTAVSSTVPQQPDQATAEKAEDVLTMFEDGAQPSIESSGGSYDGAKEVSISTEGAQTVRAAAVRSPVVVLPPQLEHQSPKFLTDISEYEWTIEHIRRELLVLAASSGHLSFNAPWSAYTVEDLLEQVARGGNVPRELDDAIRFVSRLGKNASQLRDLMDTIAFTAGEALDKLSAIERVYTCVAHSNAMVQSDVVTGPVSAVILQQYNRRGKLGEPHVYPCNRTYKVGEVLSWEWTPPTFPKGNYRYRDPATGEWLHAWTAATTFAGRAYPHDWFVRSQHS